MNFIAATIFLVYATLDCVASDKLLARNVEAELPGIYKSESKSKYTIEITNPNSTLTKNITLTILDARAKERKEGLSKRDFFNKYGFVILEHTSAMSGEDWVATNRNVTELIESYDNSDEYKKLMDQYQHANTPGKQIYSKEIEEMIRLVLPDAKEVIAPAKGILRAPNTTASPIKALHSDYGIDFERLVNTSQFIDFHPHRKQYEDTTASEIMLVNFWRPVLPMSQPLRSNPLCFLDTSTVDIDDIVMLDITKNGKFFSEIISLKESPRHQFYYYPDMTIDEVIVFKQFHQVRDESSARLPTFHTAFNDPAANEETEERTSFEYRVAILS